MEKNITDLLRFIKRSPTAYNAAHEICGIFEKMGYTRLDEGEKWAIEPGGRYYVTKNMSSVIAFAAGRDYGPFKIIASHCDSPIFKLKDNFEISAEGKYTKLNTEKYGGMIMSSWFDRPLSVAGRVIVKEDGRLKSKIVDLEKPVLVIPNMPVHFCPEINKGYSYNAQTDMAPIAGGGKSKGEIMKMVACAAGVRPEDIISYDLYAYCAQEGTVAGVQDEYILAPRIDDLECAFASIKAFCQSENKGSGINMCCVFDNEEVGSGTKQGADSTFLDDVITRITYAMGKDGEDKIRTIARSFMVSADNAHSMHPNHPEKYDAGNRVYMNEGVVIKFNANQRYTSDGVSAAIFKEICRKAGVPVQNFANRSDIAGGSTLGNISNSHVSLNTVDIGLPQLAMHSAVETTGAQDFEYMISAMTELYDSEIVIKNDEEYEVR